MTAAASRAVSAAELLAGASIVIGHNVIHVVPNEVPILFALGLLSARWRDGAWSAFGLRPPASWSRTALIALGAAALRIALGALVVEPVTGMFWPPAAAPSGAEKIAGDPGTALTWLLIVWTFAAFGEEVGYRGYLLTRAADLAGRTPAAFGGALILTSVLFGYGHYYKGPSGIIDSAVAGPILGGVYLLSGRNLWTSILAHGFIDTFGVIAAFFGWDT